MESTAIHPDSGSKAHAGSFRKGMITHPTPDQPGNEVRLGNLDMKTLAEVRLHMFTSKYPF